jgi:hypothetical protein
VTIEDFQIGRFITKNEDAWIANDFDEWGRGIGIGEIVEPPFDISDLNQVDVRWPSGRCFEDIDQLILVPDERQEANS